MTSKQIKGVAEELLENYPDISDELLEKLRLVVEFIKKEYNAKQT